MIRTARIASTSDSIAAYLPSNYKIVKVTDTETIIQGEDNAGWTLDGYVIPRLASGLHFAREFTACAWHPERPVHNLNMCEYCYDNYLEALAEKGH